MSKKPQYDPEEIRYPDQHIVESPLVPEMENSYIEYAMSVIVGRALPDVRDGLKPVHRRILYGTKLFIVNSNLHALRAGIKTHIELAHDGASNINMRHLL